MCYVSTCVVLYKFMRAESTSKETTSGLPKPFIIPGRSVPYTMRAAAHERVAAGHIFGKLVLRVGQT